HHNVNNLTNIPHPRPCPYLPPPQPHNNPPPTPHNPNNNHYHPFIDNPYLHTLIHDHSPLPYPPRTRPFRRERHRLLRG
ncbi:hypothetical protein, partial [Kocuria rosea]|uniref:hypothetical protein n=1 Tax=Kocuria rosea TaxID=1275 RepID=UPI001C92FD2F